MQPNDLSESDSVRPQNFTLADFSLKTSYDPKKPIT